MNTWRLEPVAGMNPLRREPDPVTGKQAIPVSLDQAPITLVAKPLHSRHRQVTLKAARRSQGMRQSKHGHMLNALTCSFAPLAGLEPAPHGLEVDL